MFHVTCCCYLKWFAICFAKLLLLSSQRFFIFHVQKTEFFPSCRKYSESAKYFNAKRWRLVKQSAVKTLTFYSDFPSVVMVPENCNLSHFKILILIIWNNRTLYIEPTIKISFVKTKKLVVEVLIWQFPCDWINRKNPQDPKKACLMSRSGLKHKSIIKQSRVLFLAIIVPCPELQLKLV